MQSIAKDVYIEDQFLGVTLGAINLPQGLIQVDAPLAPEDGRTWRATLLNLGGSAQRLLINLDAHPDRTIGVRAMDCTVISHEKAAQIFRSRPTTFKAQVEETGADWETLSGVGNVRWALPEIVFSQQLTIHWGNMPVLTEHHPGPSAGASWVSIPEVKVVFVGDAILRNQPPFLATADLPTWIDTLKLLLTPTYRGYLIISGRSGLVTVEAIRAQIEHLGQILTRLEKLAAKQSSPEAIENLVPALLSGWKFPANRQQQFAQRLRFGLHHYYINHYHPANNAGGKE